MTRLVAGVRRFGRAFRSDSDTELEWAWGLFIPVFLAVFAGIILLLWRLPQSQVQGNAQADSELINAYGDVAEKRTIADARRDEAARLGLALDVFILKAPPEADKKAKSDFDKAVREAKERVVAAKSVQDAADREQANAEKRLMLDQQRQDLRAKRLTDENELRRTLVQILGGLFFFVTAFITWRTLLATERNAKVAQDNLKVTQDKQLSERFTKATESLDRSKPMSVRLGGIYSLERLAKDSDSEVDRSATLQVLTSYLREGGLARRPVRENSVSQSDAVIHSDDKVAFVSPENRPLRQLEPDEEAVVSVLRRWQRQDGDPKVDLRDSFLPVAFFLKAQLPSANFCGAYMFGAFFVEAELIKVFSDKACLQEACFRKADLTAAKLREANLRHADFTDAKVYNADLRGADLRGAILTHEQLETAITDETTQIDPHLVVHKSTPSSEPTSKSSGADADTIGNDPMGLAPVNEPTPAAGRAIDQQPSVSKRGP